MKWTDHFYYDESSPSGLRRATDCLCGDRHLIVKHLAGEVAGSQAASHGYWLVTANGKRYLAHRVVWSILNGEIPDGYHIDHVDGDKTNNRGQNLRAVPRSVNMRNCKRSRSNTSGVTGVNLKVNTNKHGTVHCYWVASWQDGRRRERNFSVSSLGDEEAFRLACEFRATMIASLNTAGAGYTERHGT